jgi:hypothetical protein
MSASYGVRLTSPGPNRLGVLARIRPILGTSPANVKASLDGDQAVLLTVDISRSHYGGPQKVDHWSHLYLLWFSPSRQLLNARLVNLGWRSIAQRLVGTLLVVEP